MEPSERPAHVALRRLLGAVVATAATVGLTACAPSDDGPSGEEITSTFLADLAEVCTTTAEQLGALEQPSGDEVSEFATAVAGLLRAEADAVRELETPTEIDDVVRDFVLNTDDQAATWESISSAGPEELAGLTEAVASLALTRDEITAQLGVDACLRADT